MPDPSLDKPAARPAQTATKGQSDPGATTTTQAATLPYNSPSNTSKASILRSSPTFILRSAETG
jgi:hypothetical protein